LLYFPKNLKRIATALLEESLMNKRFVPAELPMTRLVDRGTGWFHQVFVNGFLFHAQIGGNLSGAVALLVEDLHTLIASHSSLLSGSFRRIIPFEWQIFTEEYGLSGTQELVNLWIAATNGLVDSFMKVLADVEAVSHLNGLRSADASGFRVLSSSVTADDLDGRIALEPSCRRCSVPRGKDIKPTVPFQVTDDGPVSSTTTPGPVIETDHARRIDRLIRETTEQAQKGIWATTH